MRSPLIYVLVILLSVILLVGCNANDMEDGPSGAGEGQPIMKNVSNEEAEELIEDNEDLIILDVRTLEEYQSGHIKGAINIPLGELESRLGELDKNTPILIYCRSGNRSANAARILNSAEFSEVYNLRKGISQWGGEIVTEQ